MNRIGSVKGIPVILANDYIFVVAIITILAGVNYGIGSALNVIAMVATLSTIVLLHEFGHALTARAFGVKTRSITLHCIGGLAAIDPDEYAKFIEKPRRSLLIWFAGPAVNLVLGGMVGLIMAIWVSFSGTVAIAVISHPTLWHHLHLFGSLNLVLMAFNLLPIFPLDGGGMLYSILAMITTRARAIRATSIVGMIGGICLIVLAVIYWAPIPGIIGLMAFIASKDAPKNKVFRIT